MRYEISKRMSSLKPSAIREILKYSADPEVISLAAGDPAPESLPKEDIAKILSEILDKDPMKALLYSQSEGYPELRQMLTDMVLERYNIISKTENLLVTSGAQQAIDLATKVICNDGDTIICEKPSFVGALNTFRSYNVNLVGVEIESDGISLDGVKKALAENPNTKLLYLIPNFQNPTGITMSLEKRKAIYEIAKEHDVLILEDNPYGDLRFEGDHVPAIKSFDDEDIVIYAGSFSKILSSGLRLGYMISPSAIMPKIIVAKQCTDVHTSMISQLVCYNFLKKYDLDEHINKLKHIYKEKAELMISTIDEHFPSCAKRTNPDGGLFVWCTLPEGFDSGEFATKLVQESKVCIVPGNAFLVNTAEKSNSFRLNFSKTSKADIKKAVEIVGKKLKETL